MVTHAQMVTEVGGWNLATNFGFVSDCLKCDSCIPIQGSAAITMETTRINYMLLLPVI